jgi:hypothetical protein
MVPGFCAETGLQLNRSQLQAKMSRFFSLVIIGLVMVSIFAVLFITQRQAMDKAIQGEGNGTFYEMKRGKSSRNGCLYASLRWSLKTLRAWSERRDNRRVWTPAEESARRSDRGLGACHQKSAHECRPSNRLPLALPSWYLLYAAVSLSD